MDKHTIKTYNKSASHFSQYFSGIGSRVEDIEKALNLLNKKENVQVFEIGCGDGRDAEEIVKLVEWYEGLDPSKELLKIAKIRLPETKFMLGDALNYTYPSNIDLIFAFASLLHINRNDLISVFDKVQESLVSGGVFYISLKHKEKYEVETKTDEYGKRTFYYYNPQIIEKMASNSFSTVFTDFQQIGKTKWFTIALKKE